ncbi:MAG: helix-turn-helix transcriptional regulator [Myxococcota bacterium]
MAESLFQALLKFWRGKRGLSQLDLALAAGVSVRHVSFLETGRSSPSPSMVRRLAQTLGVPLRATNEMLRAAGHAPAFEESKPAIDGAAADVIERLKRHHEPYPLVVIDRLYTVLDLNRGAIAMLGAMLGEAPPADLNLARLTFDPQGAHPLIANFDEVGRELLWRIQRESFERPDDAGVRALLDDLLAMPTVDEHWREIDLDTHSAPAVVLHLKRGDIELRFVTVVTVFQAPQNVALEELRIETWLPVDAATEAACQAFR